MEPFSTERPKSRISPGHIIGALIGLLFIGGLIWLISLRPPAEDQQAKMLEGAMREGTPEFADVSKDIIIATDDRTVESPTGLGTISMYIVGRIRNKGQKMISLLEINVGVVDQQNNVLKEKRVLVVPLQQPELGPDDTIPVTLALEGFDPKADRANIRWKVTAIKTAN